MVRLAALGFPRGVWEPLYVGMTEAEQDEVIHGLLSALDGKA